MSRARGLAIVSATPAIGGAASEAAALAVAAAGGCREGGALLIDLQSVRPPRGTVLASEAARRLVASPAWGGLEVSRCARGRLGVISAADPELGSELLEASADCGLPRVVHVGPAGFRALLDAEPAGSPAVLLRSEALLDRSLSSALAIELRAAGVPHKVWTRGLGIVGARRARAGLDPGGEGGARAARAAAALLGEGAELREPVGSARRALARAESGQALIALIGMLALVAALSLALVAIGGAVTAKGRAQRAVDLAALSAARSMRDDFARRFVPARRPDGSRDPRHLSRDEYLDRARAAASEAAERNGLSPASLLVSFPERDSLAPLRADLRARPRIELAGRELAAGGDPTTAARTEVAASAVAEIAPAAAVTPASMATGGGYAGPLAYRQGKPMRPDVAAAFDRLSRAAAAAGHALVVNSGFRSDAEQARLFAANPDPRWVAPPGRSLHRCATELDLGPAPAYGWLDANAPRFGFERRYSWEAWHFGFTAGPPPCAASAERVAAGGDDGAAAAGLGLPGFVPAFARRPLLAAAARHGVSAALLAAQLLAESNFDPAAVSPAGARGIAQFMPATAAAYGLDDPFDVGAAIDAQGAADGGPARAVRLDRAGARGLQRRSGAGRGLRMRAGLSGDAGLRGPDPRPARRCR